MTITKKERIDQFKRDLKSLSYYKSKRDEISDKLMVVDRVLFEPKANSYTKECTSGTYNYIDLLEREHKLKEEFYLYDQLIKKIGNQLDRIENREDRDMIIDIYVHKISFEKMAMNHYISTRNLKYQVNQIIAKIL